MIDTTLDLLRPGMFVIDGSGSLLGRVREVSGRSVLVAELDSPRVFWVPGQSVDSVRGREVRLVSTA